MSDKGRPARSLSPKVGNSNIPPELADVPAEPSGAGDRLAGLADHSFAFERQGAPLRSLSLQGGQQQHAPELAAADAHRRGSSAAERRPSTVEVLACPHPRPDADAAETGHSPLGGSLRAVRHRFINPTRRLLAPLRAL